MDHFLKENNFGTFRSLLGFKVALVENLFW